MNDYTFGNFLCELRTEKGLSQSQLGDMMGVSNKAVSKWEMGISKPRPAMLVVLASFLGVTVEELLAGRRNAETEQQEYQKNNDAALTLCAGKYRKNKMKKALLIFLSVLLSLFLLGVVFIVFILSLFSCGWHSKQTNYFFEGTYTNDEYKLTVTAIDEETYKSKDGINVVEDKSIKRTNQYYEVALCLFDEDSQSYIELTFHNLVLASVEFAEPCYYEDENGNGICPYIQRFMGYVLIYQGQNFTLR